MVMSSTSACATCGHRPNPIEVLYAELRNEQASVTDAVFWAIIGGVVASLVWWVGY